MADPVLTMQTVASQTTGIDPGLRAQGGIDGWDWMTKGWPATGGKRPPSGFTSLTGYGHEYAERGKPFVACNVLIKRFQTFVHRNTGGWSLVQDTNLLNTHGYWRGDYGASSPHSPIVRQANEEGFPVDRIRCPNYGDIEHFWPAGRGQYPANTVDGAFTAFLCRVDNAASNFIMAAGIDWWRSTSASVVHVDNPALSVSSWLKMTTNWQWCVSTDNTIAQLTADPPPPLKVGVVVPPVDPPVDPPIPPVEPPVIVIIPGGLQILLDGVPFKGTLEFKRTP